MMGKSWGGFNALQVAARRPPALQAIITVYSTDDRYADDIHHMGGCLLTENPNWSFVMFPSLARPPDPQLVGPAWRDLWQQRLEQARPWIIDWLRHQRRDDYWKHGSVCEDFAAIACPIFAVGGWADPYTNPVPRLLEGLKVPRKALIGPWGHQYPHQANPGPKAGFLQEALRWWDHWLKDRDQGLMDEPMLKFWMHDAAPPRAVYEERPGRWLCENRWPSPAIRPRRYHLNAEGLGSEAGAETALSLHCPQTLGACTPFWGNNGAGDPECPLDQRPDDGLSLCFDSEPLAEPLAFLGAPVLELELAVERPQAFLAVRLSEVLAGGPVAEVSFGLLNLTHREGHETPRPLRPGERVRVRVTLNDNAHRFAAGSRIRVALSTALWPMVWPSPEPVTLTLFAGSGWLELPLRDPRPEDGAVEAPPLAEQSRVQERRILEAAEPTVARFEQDAGSGFLNFHHVEDDGTIEIARHGWFFSDRTERRYSIHPDDPTTARIEWRGLQRYGRRGELDLRIEASQCMTCDTQDFHLQASPDRLRGRPAGLHPKLAGAHPPRRGVNRRYVIAGTTIWTQ